MIGVFAIIRTFGLHVDQGNRRRLTRNNRAYSIPFWRMLTTACGLSQAFDFGLETSVFSEAG
jgi:hypothetical protein